MAQPVLVKKPGPLLDPNMVAAPDVDFGNLPPPQEPPPPILGSASAGVTAPDPRIEELDAQIAQLWKQKNELAQSGYGFGDAIIGTKPKQMAMLDSAISQAMEMRRMYLPDSYNRAKLAADRAVLDAQGQQIGAPFVSGANRVVPYASSTGQLRTPVLGPASLHESTVTSSSGAVLAAPGTPRPEEIVPPWRETAPERPVLVPEGGLALMPGGKQIKNPKTFDPNRAPKEKEEKLPDQERALLRDMRTNPQKHTREFAEIFGKDWKTVRSQNPAKFAAGLEAYAYKSAGMEPPERLSKVTGGGEQSWQQTPGGTRFRPAQ